MCDELHFTEPWLSIADAQSMQPTTTSALLMSMEAVMFVLDRPACVLLRWLIIAGMTAASVLL